MEILGIYFIVKMFSADSYVFQFLSKKNLTRIADSHVARIASCFTVLEKDDYLPVDTNVLKNYYRNTFLQLVDKVRKIYKLIT